MKRPPKLHIHPEETYPTNRLLNQMFHSAPYVIEEMSQMTFFVYEFYMRKVQALKETYVSVNLIVLSNRRLCAVKMCFVSFAGISENEVDQTWNIWGHYAQSKCSYPSGRWSGHGQRRWGGKGGGGGTFERSKIRLLFEICNLNLYYLVFTLFHDEHRINFFFLFQFLGTKWRTSKRRARNNGNHLRTC